MLLLVLLFLLLLRSNKDKTKRGILYLISVNTSIIKQCKVRHILYVLHKTVTLFIVIYVLYVYITYSI